MRTQELYLFRADLLDRDRVTEDAALLIIRVVAGDFDGALAEIAEFGERNQHVLHFSGEFPVPI